MEYKNFEPDKEIPDQAIKENGDSDHGREKEPDGEILVLTQKICNDIGVVVYHICGLI